MLNYDEHKEEIDKIFKEGKSLCEVNQRFIKAHCWGCSSDKEMRTNCQIKTLEWLCQEHKEPLLSDDAINYLMTLILPYGLNELDSIIKINLGDELKYKLCVILKDCEITVYFQRGTELCQWFDNLENGIYYNAKELGLC